MNELCHWAPQTQAHPQITLPRLVPHCLSRPSPALPLSPTYSSTFPTASSILTPFTDRLTCHTPTTSVPSHTLCFPRVAGLLARKPRSWLLPAECAGPQCRHQSFLLATVPVAGTGLPRIQLLGSQRTAVKCPWLMSTVT